MTAVSAWPPHSFRRLPAASHFRLAILAIGLLLGTLLGPAIVRGQETWTRVSSGTAQTLWGVTWSGSSFIAVGEGGTILSSPDGVVWALRASGTSNWLTAIGSGGGQLVVVGDKGTVLTSQDGLSWTARDSGTSERLNAVAQGNGRWLAVGEHGAIATSVGGVTWSATASTSPSVANTWFRGLGFGYGQFVATGLNGTFVSTVDGTGLFVQTIPTSAYFEAVAFAQNKFVAAGSDGVIVSSPDAVTWRGGKIPVQLRSLAVVNNAFIGGAANGSIQISPDGTNWAARATGNSSALLAVAASPSTVIAVGAGGTILRSSLPQVAPTIVSAPADVTEVAGNNVLLRVAVTGTGPLVYGWARSGRPLPEATTDTLVLKNVSAADAGTYTVTIGNAVGFVTSAPAKLNVIASAPAPSSPFDSTFAATLAASPAALLVQPDGKIVVGGNGGFLGRFNVDGSPDASFARDTTIPAAVTIASLVLQPDGKIIAAGNDGTHGFLTRYASDGSRETTFASATLANQLFVHLALQPDGKVLVSANAPSVYRFNVDGSFDNTFQSAPISTPKGPARIKMSAVASDGKIVVMGSPTSSLLVGDPAGALARLNPDGTVDSTFTIQQNMGGEPRLLQVLPTGQLLVAWINVAPFSGGYWRVARLNANGTADLGFNPILGSFGRYGGTMSAVAENSGALVVGLASIAPNTWQVSRYRADGTPDQTLFGSGSDLAVTGVAAMAATSDQRVLLAGTAGYPSNQPVLVRFVTRNVAFAANPPVVASNLNVATLNVPGGSTVNLPVSAAGTAPFSTVWSSTDPSQLPFTYFGTDFALTVPNIRNSASFRVTLTNAAGTITSPPTQVNVVPAAPSFITTAPGEISASAGRAINLGATFAGSGPLTYEWVHNGVAQGPAPAGVNPVANTIWITPDAVGTYQLVVRNALGSATATFNVTIDPSSRIANLSTRGFVGTGDAVMITGFVISGYDTKHVLIRGIGPGLAAFGVSGYVSDPRLVLFDSQGRKLAENDNASNDDATRPFPFNSVGMFPLAPGTLDAVINTSLPPGAYTVQLSGNNGATGIGLAEVYEETVDNPKLINLSTRVLVRAGDAVAIAGIIINGALPKRLLIRAVGPSLSRFGLSNPLPSPAIALMNESGTAIATNQSWSNSPDAAAIASTATSVGAFPLSDAHDAAILVTVNPGSYTAIVSSATSATGLALVEVYEVKAEGANEE